MIIPANSSIFTADAVSMYTTINTETTLCTITRYFHPHTELVNEVIDLSMELLLEALLLIISKNAVCFGNMHWLKLTGTVMVTRPAPPYATMFFGIHEELILQELPRNLLQYCCFIDAIFGVWVDLPGQEDRWLSFTIRLNDFGLE
jgi:hypothetical protein